MSTIKRWLNSIFAIFVLNTYDFLFRIRDIWCVHIRKKINDYDVTRSLSGDTRSIKKVAIVAVYPTEYSMPFTRNLVSALKDNDFLTVAVSSRKLAPLEREELHGIADVVIERFPVGRDFGSYKVGLKWVEQNRGSLPGLDTLAIANDSMYYPKKFTSHVKELLAQPGSWKAIYESWGPVYHAQSYFEVFDKDIFDSPTFKKYWDSYKPFSTRRHAIKRGEIGLSTRLIRKGKFSPPTVLFSSASVFDAIASDLTQARDGALSRTVEVGGYDIAMPYSELSDILTKLSVGYLSGSSEKSGPSENGELVNTLQRLITNEIAARMSKLLEEHNPTHILAMVANSTFQAPLKRDLCWRGSFTLGYLLNNAKGFDEAELACIEQDIRKRGLPASIRGIARILWASSRI